MTMLQQTWRDPPLLRHRHSPRTLNSIAILRPSIHASPVVHAVVVRMFVVNRPVRIVSITRTWTTTILNKNKMKDVVSREEDTEQQEDQDRNRDIHLLVLPVIMEESRRIQCVRSEDTIQQNQHGSWLGMIYTTSQSTWLSIPGGPQVFSRRVVASSTVHVTWTSIHGKDRNCGKSTMLGKSSNVRGHRHKDDPNKKTYQLLKRVGGNFGNTRNTNRKHRKKYVANLKGTKN